ncbi:hypothetical protein E3O45_03855 [Cryobacterium sp. TMS1-20-1]|jgi:hypothetical protein|uniref:TPM domain-containing protein n=4 Tax=Cryobacterium TaxID=69578 RepID=A0A4R9AWJ9_9MICO|nr:MULTISPECIES: hypothetical protein [Cryobacterium]TFC79419.1 hypothetical protein E3O45_03855 [Cryobacterium sp. TMS1-20-1]TFD10555.1 hypothetical protein E3T35_12515 [Cryobacterium sp. TMT1-2-2]TFD21324.1 hypothetical protein E3T31_10860 [Cryobacterium sp. TMS1-13-1]TFD56484.1 hypothetical protein E3T41_14880 [Cryobacterium sp. Hh38]TFD63707.1 hypothetical protein E3T38_16130 [Cryobacterium sp. Hb1]
MKKIAIGVVAALLLSGFAYSPAFAETSSAPVEASGSGMVDEEKLESAFNDAGLTLEDVDASLTKISVETTSDLGSGEPVTALTTLSFEDSSALFSLGSIDTDYNANYSIQIQELNDEATSFTMTDLATGETESYADDVGYAAFVPVLVLGIPIALEILKTLLVASAVVIVAGVTWIAATNAIDALNKKGSSYQHFRAMILNGKLVLANGMSLSAAITWGRGGKDTWSRSEAGALAVAKGIKNGLAVVGPERDSGGRGKFAHFHPSNRTPAMHAFFGLPN